MNVQPSDNLVYRSANKLTEVAEKQQTRTRQDLVSRRPHDLAYLMVSLSKPTLEIKFQAPQQSSSRLVNEDCGLDDEVLPDLAGGLGDDDFIRPQPELD